LKSQNGKTLESELVPILLLRKTAYLAYHL
jgi:hypothetical protein